MSGNPFSIEEHSSGKLFLASLVVAYFASGLPPLLVGLLLVDIGDVFGYPVGVAGQIRTLAMSLGVVFALLMSVMSTRFRHKSLLVTGLLLYSIAALGCGFAPSFTVMLVSYSFVGVGASMVSPMCFTLVGERFPREKQGWAIGWIVAGGSLAYVVGSPVIAYFAGWRLAFLEFVFPVILLSILLTAKGLPSASPNHQSKMSIRDYLEGFMGVFSNSSAVACLVGSALSGAAFMAILIYSPSFFRHNYAMPTGLTSIFVLVAALCYTSGSLMSGLFIKRVGRKPLTVLTALFAGIFIISYTSLPDLRLSLVSSLLGCLFAGMRFAASTGLTLEQVPSFRGTMMSLNHATVALADALGSGVGGLVILLLDYGPMAIMLGALGIAAAVVFHFLTTDPARTQVPVVKSTSN